MLRFEAFVHGAMCIFLLRTLYLVKIAKGMRDANREVVLSLAVGSMTCMICRLDKERKGFKGLQKKNSPMSAVDMSMIDHIPDMIKNGVDSLKIERRMKSIHYVSTVSSCYKAAVMLILKV